MMSDPPGRPSVELLGSWIFEVLEAETGVCFEATRGVCPRITQSGRAPERRPKAPTGGPARVPPGAPKAASAGPPPERAPDAGRSAARYPARAAAPPCGTGAGRPESAPR